VKDDVVQTFRNFVDSIVTHQVHKRMKRDALLILLDEFDVIKNKNGLGSLIKSLTSQTLKFAVCGIGHDLSELVEDHASVERLLEEGAIHVQQMQPAESEEIIYTAEKLFQGQLTFDREVIKQIAKLSDGYPYFTQLIGKECVAQASRVKTNRVDDGVFSQVLQDIRSGRAFPTLEKAYQRAIGNSAEREILLHLLAGQEQDQVLYNDELGQVALKQARKDAEDLQVAYVDQLLPRLVEARYGPILRRASERQGVYEFVNPVLRLYIKLRQLHFGDRTVTHA
jgi:hypothetical protein